MSYKQRETELGYNWSPQQSPMESFTPMECGSGSSPGADGPFSLSALMNFPDNCSELFSPSTAAQMLSPYSSSFSPFNYSGFQQLPPNWASLASPVDSSDTDAFDAINPNRNSGFESGISLTSPVVDNSGNSMDGDDEMMTRFVPRSMPGVSLSERMLRVLSLFRESLGGGILAQVWMPVKHGDDYVLSTTDQPFLLDQNLAGYREVSRAFTFSAQEAPGLFPGLPGRVFISGMPEWTSNVVYYNRFEYLRSDYAVSHEVRGSLAVPIFGSQDSSCCAVLELVTKKEKPNFDMELESVCNALQAVNLRTMKARAHPQALTKNKKSAFTEILDVLRTCCHAHMLPLALTWVPFSYDCESDHTMGAVSKQANSSLPRKNLLSIQNSACYVNDSQMEGFLHACAEHCLEEGQGIAGKAFQSKDPFFCPNVKDYDIREYPFAHHARKFGLHAAVAIRLRSTHTGNDDYILEFFLPINCKGSPEQQELLNNLSNTMQRICRSLRTVSDAEIVGVGTTKTGTDEQAGTSSQSPNNSIKNSQRLANDSDMTVDRPFDDPSTGSDGQGEESNKQSKSGSMRQQEKKRSTAEKNVSLSVLQQYFSGSLKDAAKSIGVCPTTLKRICRQHGITRWPSRKINKVNRSLKKIQTVIDSVQGVEGALKYDPTTGCLVAAVTPEKPAITSSEFSDREVILMSSAPHTEAQQFVRKFEVDEVSEGHHEMENSNQFAYRFGETDKLHDPQGDCNDDCKITEPSLEADIKGIEEMFCKGASNKGGLSLVNFDSQIESRSSDAIIDLQREHSHHSSSNMTDSSSGSASSCPVFQGSPKSKVAAVDNGMAFTVKATYKEDTVRFKFIPSMGFHHLLEEIGKRLMLSVGTFQLKYMDDEEEWVLLTSNSDLHECIEIQESLRSHNLKLLVRDVPCAIGSSGGSNCMLTEV